MPDDNGSLNTQSGWLSAGVQAGTAIGRGIGAGARQKRARKWQLEDWDRVNAYNHPQAQMQRLKEAKLNPQLAVGGTSTGNASSIDSNNLQTSAAEEISAGAAETINNYQDHRVKKAQTQNLKADALKKAAETINTGIKNEADMENLRAVKAFSMDNASLDNQKKEHENEILFQEQKQRQKLYKSEKSIKESQALIESAKAKLARAGLTKAPWGAQAMKLLSREEFKAYIQSLIK